MPNKYQYQTTNIQKLLFALICIYFNLFIFIDKTYAQGISLSITPPIFEVTIAPNKTVKQIYKLQNIGSDISVTPTIVYFTPSDKVGNVELTNNPSPEWIKYDPSTFYLKSNDIKEFEVTFSPPNNIDESDHFLSLVFETGEAPDILNQNSLGYTTKIVSNILLTVSKDNKINKSVQIVDFSAPKIIDSFFGKIKYNIELKNDGDSFWKANGKINSKYGTLKLAPLNVIPESNRKIICLNNEDLVECQLDTFFLIGKITSNLEFNIDDDGKIYSKEINTYAFPFFVLLTVPFLLTLNKFGLIVRLWRKRRS